MSWAYLDGSISWIAVSIDHKTAGFNVHRWENMTNQPPKLLDQVTDDLRLRHYAYRTEQQYLHCIRRYILFHHRRHPADMGAAEIEASLAHLAVYNHIAPLPKNQALAAHLFLYRDVLKQPIQTLASDQKPLFA